jgi:alanyl-tRNA synthetase
MNEDWLEIITDRFEDYGFPFEALTSIIPHDDSTLFVCSGMQNLKPRFEAQDGGALSSLQACVRTNDLDLVGDGTHLTHFGMLGNFSFAGPHYAESVEMWDYILDRIGLDDKVTIHVHPTQQNHRDLWERRKYPVVWDDQCVWSADGKKFDYCCEVYLGDLEIGNLVNPSGHSTDVGFGWERLLMVLEGKNRVDEISLFNQSLDPISRDHVRTIDCFWDNGISPGNKGRNYVCRRLIRRILHNGNLAVRWGEWSDEERRLREKCLAVGKRLKNRHKDKSTQWWWETCGLLPEEIQSL